MLGIRSTDPVHLLVSTPVATIRPTDTLRAAAIALAADQVGLLVVVDVHGVRGVLSERDLVNAIVEDLELDQARVRDSASTELVSVTESTPIVDAAAAMAAAEVRHLAVTRDGVVTGVVSVRDIVHVLLETQRDLDAAST